MGAKKDRQGAVKRQETGIKKTGNGVKKDRQKGGSITRQARGKGLQKNTKKGV